MRVQPAAVRITLLGVFTAILALAVSCGSAAPSAPAVQEAPQQLLPGGLSRAAHEAAVNRIFEIGAPGKQSGPCRSGGDIECRDFEVACAKSLALTEADEAIGVAEKWCVQESFCGCFMDLVYWSV
jgi:hypothetical protein